VFVNADEPLEVRRQQILARLKKKAENQGHIPVVSSSGVLSNGIETYWLQRGYLNGYISANISLDGYVAPCVI